MKEVLVTLRFANCRCPEDVIRSVKEYCKALAEKITVAGIDHQGIKVTMANDRIGFSIRTASGAFDFHVAWAKEEKCSCELRIHSFEPHREKIRNEFLGFYADGTKVKEEELLAVAA